MSDTKKKLFLLDAYALIYRAHFGFTKNPRINSKGINTSVPFGFTNTMLEVIQKEKPTHIAVAFDTSAPTFRDEMFEEYKATRQETPEDIRYGTPKVKEIIRGFNIPILECDGFEADDVIGTIAHQAARKGFEVFMMTPDKDFGQLVEEHVYLYKPAFMGNAVDVLGIAEVCAKWDIENVGQVKDMLGLQGDVSDNIPGIPGIGPKTAAVLIKKYGSVEGVVAHAHELKGKQKEMVEQYGEQAILSKKLATIVTDVPVEFDEAALVYTGPEESVLKPIFNDLEFRTIAARLFPEGKKVQEEKPKGTQLSMFAGKASAPAPEGAQGHSGGGDYVEVGSVEEWKKWIDGFGKLTALGIEAYAGESEGGERELKGLALSVKPGESRMVFFSPDEGKHYVKPLEGLLADTKIRKAGYNLKATVLLMRAQGLSIEGPLFDILIAHYLIEPEASHDLAIIAQQYLQRHPTGEGARGMGERVDLCLQLVAPLEAELDRRNHRTLMEEVEMPLVMVLAGMESEGVKIDGKALEKLSEELKEESAKVQKEIYELAGSTFNISSPKQLGEVLFDKMKLVEKPKKTPSGQYATGEEILQALSPEHPIASKILDYREYEKLRSTYVDALPRLIGKDGRIHTDYRQAVAATGRLSSINPNLQNIPIRTEKGREIRKAFVPRGRDYLFMSADYSQIELRIAAAFAKDETMIEAFRTGQDIHTTTAAKVFNVPIDKVDTNMRRKAKEVNFGILYGSSSFGLAQNLGISRTEASEIIQSYFKKFPGIKQYMDQVIEMAKEKEYVETLLGRRRYLRDINSRNQATRGFAERNAINAPIQGTAADIIKVAMIHIDAWLKKEGLKTKMILQVHDELVFDLYKDEEEKVKKKVIHLMKTAVELAVPMEVEVGVGANWLEAH